MPSGPRDGVFSLLDLSLLSLTTGVPGELTEERMFISRLKRLLLVLPGVLNLAWGFAAREGKRHEIQVRRHGKIVDLRNQNHIIRVLPRNVRQAPEVCRQFELYRRVLPITRQDEIEVTDFSANPDALIWEQMCLEWGVTIESRDLVAKRHARRSTVLRKLATNLHQTDAALGILAWGLKPFFSRRNGASIRS